jgi:hypothetical protein
MNYLKIISFLFLVPLVVLGTKPLKTEEIVIPIENRSWQEQVIYYSNLYDTDSDIIFLLIENESQGRDVCGDNGLSCGILQYQKNTFQRHLKLLGEELEWRNTHDQIKLVSYIFSLDNEALKREWTAYRCIKNGGKYSFYSKQLKQHFNITCKFKL